jgi:hypothetical protein
MTLEAYLISKRIDAQEFRVREPDQWQEWALLWEQLSPESFGAQKLYLFNALRRKYKLKEIPAVPSGQLDAPQPAAKKPIFKPKIS